jgi:excisionase family DNA binding protein
VKFTIDIPDEFIDALADAVAQRINAKHSMHDAAPARHKWLTHSEAAAYLRKTPATLYKLTSNREIKYRKRGKSNTYKIEDLDLWLEAGAIETADQLVKDVQLLTRRKHSITKQ